MVLMVLLARRVRKVLQVLMVLLAHRVRKVLLVPMALPARRVRKVLQAPMLGGQHSEAADRRKTSDANLDRLGFTKYQKVGDGKYEKTAGVGPKSITRE
jgi:hypothetical protein